MPSDQILIGTGVAILCALGLYNDRWLLENTRKGQRLTAWLGDRHALRALRLLLAAGLLFGTLLASGTVNPVRW